MKIGDKLDIPVTGSDEFGDRCGKSIHVNLEIYQESIISGLYIQLVDDLYFDMRHGINYIEYENWQSNQKTGNV